jgi:hypothetical protein
MKLINQSNGKITALGLFLILSILLIIKIIWGA